MTTRGHHGLMMMAGRVTPAHPAFADVFSLLQYGGADGSTTFTDDKGLAWTAMGNAQIDTSLGYNSGLFDGAGDHIKTASTVNLVSGPFCIEHWVYMLAAPSGGKAYIACQDDGTNNSQNLQFAITTDRRLEFTGFATSSRSSFWSFNTAAAAVPLNVLAHLVVDYGDDGITRLFVDGAGLAESNNTHWAGAALPLTIGSFTDGPNDEFALARYNGHLRVSRITMASIYAADFIPPPPPFPTS